VFNNGFFFLFREACRFWDNVEKYDIARQGHRWRDNTAHATCIPDKQGKNTDPHSLLTRNAYTRKWTKNIDNITKREQKPKPYKKEIIAFPLQQLLANVPQYYVIRKLSVLFIDLIASLSYLYPHKYMCFDITKSPRVPSTCIFGLSISHWKHSVRFRK
jgi:hypothetical protein